MSGSQRTAGSTAARPARTSGLRLPTLLWLTLVWVAMWGELSLFNVLAGFLVAVLVCLVFPLPSLRMHLHVRPLRLVWLVLYFVADVVKASIQVSWTTLQFRRQPLNAVIEVDLRTPSDFVLTLVAEMTSLVPGSLVVEARRSTHTLYLHVLDARDQAGVDKMRRDVLALERRIVLAFGTETDHLERPPSTPAAPSTPEKESP